MQHVQRWAKVGLELYTRAVEADVGEVDMKKYDALTHDTLTDPVERPPIIPLPKLPELPNFGFYFKLGAATLISLSALGMVFLVRRRPG